MSASMNGSDVACTAISQTLGTSMSFVGGGGRVVVVGGGGGVAGLGGGGGVRGSF